MKKIYQIVIFTFISISCFAQSKLVGDWTISNEKKITLNNDQSFKLTKGTFVHDGDWTYLKNKKDNDQLILKFKEKEITYIIEKIERNSIQLYDQSKGQIIVLKRIELPSKKAQGKKELNTTENKNEIQNSTEPNNKNFDKFSKGKFVVNPGYGLINYIDSLPVNLNSKTPSLSILLEKSFGAGIGLGLKMGYRQWEDQESGLTAALYSSSLRMTYHVKVLEKLDPYVGVGATLRFATLGSADLLSPKWSHDFTPIIGARYYLLNRFAFTAEFAYDNSSNVTLGFAILLK